MAHSSEVSRVIVTAAGSGIGRAIAEHFLASKAKVHICDISQKALDDTLSSNPGMRGSISNVGNPNDVDSLFAEATAWMGGLDVLVNNAGIGGPNAPLDETEDDEWDQTIQVNLNGAFYCAKRAARLMKQQGSGCIINISSTSAKTGLPNRTPYVVSKVGLEGLTRNLARELGPFGIRCNALLPGSIENERGHMLLQRIADRDGISVEEANNRRMQFISMRTRIEPDEIAEIAVLLTTHPFRHVSGQLLGVCGNVEWE
ncbi:MAG TPA: SDR family oxidoreductase [Gammaproteobacteria bacterium]|nr:SDR family oxidoreductase [Gammaproteobacteria bacterium]